MTDTSVPQMLSGSAALWRAMKARAKSLGRNLSEHTAALYRADLEGAGLPVPAPLPPKRNGPAPKPKRTRKR